ncbi:class I SAM-dependent methyltransferase [Kitasatospora sp. NPDC088391]|uniref:class I SAM-dependent methyltransferase n=1 Tax=Kitasatospora sp. NPDC088391 TaxID=3364074 RepID=UPI0038298AE8
MAQDAQQLVDALEGLIGRPIPIRVRLRNGPPAGPPGAPTVVLRNRRALRHLFWSPGELGLARAYVAGDLEPAADTDLYELLGAVAAFREDPEFLGARIGPRQYLGAPGRRLLAAALRQGAVGPRPTPPPEEVRRRRGATHSRRRDRAAISHHYDVGNDFYRLVLGPTLVYSCAYWEPGARSLEDAQTAKLDLVCRKLGLRPGMRLLDVGCGWGSLVLHAARRYGVRAVGVSLSAEQVALARQRVAEAGLADRVEIRLQDYREVPDGPFDAVSSVGMAEHVGSAQYLLYARRLYELLAPGGRLLNHQIARRPLPPGTAYRLSPFIDRYVFPDGELSPVGTTVSRLEDAGFEVRDVEVLREHYGRTLREWVANLEAHWPEAAALAGRGRARVWRLYMAASAVAFEQNHIGVNQVLAVRPTPAGASGFLATRAEWLAGAPEQGRPEGARDTDLGDRPSVR